MSRPEGRRASVSVTFDNLGEVADLQRGLWPPDAPLGRHFSVTRALPRVRALLDDAGIKATFFAEGRNAELYPDALRALAAEGHEVALHGWCHEDWPSLARDDEAERLERGVRAMAALGLRPVGFRPPGGRLTPATLELLHAAGFTHCSPPGTGIGVREGIVLLPFAWPVVDAFHYLPRFAPVRDDDPTDDDKAGAPARVAAALDAALQDVVARGGHLTVVFHAFLTEPDERLAVLRDHLAALRALVEEGTLWCAPHRDVAAWVSAHPPAHEALALDATPA